MTTYIKGELRYRSSVIWMFFSRRVSFEINLMKFIMKPCKVWRIFCTSC